MKVISKGGKMLKVLYTIFLAVFLAFFIGLGIEAFYTGPKSPDYPTELQYKTTPESTPGQAKLQQDYDQKLKDFQIENSHHSRNVCMIAIAASLILLILSLTLLHNVAIMSDGFLLGGLLTLLYAIIRGFESDNNRFRFLVVSVGLIAVLLLGYLKFIKTSKYLSPNKS